MHGTLYKTLADATPVTEDYHNRAPKWTFYSMSD